MGGAGVILSFSVPEMRPWLEAGIRQRDAQTIRPVAGGMSDSIEIGRVKRQTIRRRGPRALRLLEWDPNSFTHPYDLHLWWKSRTAERVLIGVARNAPPMNIYPIHILHGTITPPRSPAYPVVRICGPESWRPRQSTMFWSPGDPPGSPFAEEARKDGFETPEAFRDFFVPNVGDEFEGVLFTW